jgi:hypothetical protein
MKHIQETPAAPRSIKAGIPRAVEAVILKSLAKQPSDRFSSAAEMRTALQHSVSSGRTTVMRAVERPAPAADSATTASTSSLSAFRWLIPVMLVVAALVALAIYLPSVLGGPDDTAGRRPGGGGAGAVNPGSRSIPIRSVTSFDPEGDRTEHQELVGAVTDGDASTAWHTEHYNSALQVNKPGVGLLFDLGSSVQVDHFRITSQTPGFGFELRTGDQRGATETSFRITKSVADAARTEDVSFPASSHRYWLVWITSLPGGGGGAANINEVKFFGPSG